MKRYKKAIKKIKKLDFSFINYKPNKKEKKFKEKNGFLQIEAWNLCDAILEYTYPRLAYLRENYNGYPNKLYVKYSGNDELATKEWEEIMDTILEGFEIRINNEFVTPESDDWNKWLKAKELFCEYFDSLWD